MDPPGDSDHQLLRVSVLKFVPLCDSFRTTRIFCHSGNTFWRLENIEQDKLEEPKVPGGMTGGVEFEAMGEQYSFAPFLRRGQKHALINRLAPRPPFCVSQEYVAAHLKLLNSLARTCKDRETARQLHTDLCASGIEKVLLVSFSLSSLASPADLRAVHPNENCRNADLADP